jgi:hypothetical protein
VNGACIVKLASDQNFQANLADFFMKNLNKVLLKQ